MRAEARTLSGLLQSYVVYLGYILLRLPLPGKGHGVAADMPAILQCVKIGHLLLS